MLVTSKLSKRHQHQQVTPKMMKCKSVSSNNNKKYSLFSLVTTSENTRKDKELHDLLNASKLLEEYRK